MEHEQWRDALYELHDGELSDVERRGVLAHLESCPECRHEYQQWERISRTFFKPFQKPTPAETEIFAGRVLGRIASAKPKVPAMMWNWIAPALSIGAAALFLAVVWPRPESVAPADVLLLTDVPERGVAKLLLPPDPQQSDNMLAFLMEGK